MVEHGRPARRRFAAVGCALTAVLLLGACGSRDSSDGSDNSTSETSGSPTAQAGPFFGECGSVTDDEVRELLAVPTFGVITRDSVGCVWEMSGQWMPSVTFSWYRGSPIARERAGSELIGRPAEDIEIDGHPGFRGIGYDMSTNQAVLCEIGIEFGDDFQHWSVSYGIIAPTADPCEVAQSLAELSIGRAE